jgi:DNA-binding MarR family transcriptional regulator
MNAVSSDSSSASGSTSSPPVIAAPERPKLAAALDIADYASGTAGEAWALLARLLFLHGKPRFPAIAGELDLHPGQAIVVRLLAEPCPMGELAEAMHCDNSNITGIVDRLEERGLVERQPADYDRRVKLIALTPEGVRVREELNVRMAEPPEPLTALSDKDQEALRDILRRALEPPDA